MLETPAVVKQLDPAGMEPLQPQSDMILLSGEGSSRIFPAKRAIAWGLQRGWSLQVVTEGACQSREYDLTGYHVYVASNSGKTAEGVMLIRDLAANGRAAAVSGVVAHGGTPIAEEPESAYILSCGNEDAVAATKSVVEQALVYDILLRGATGADALDLNTLAALLQQTLTQEIAPEVIQACAGSSRIFWAGRNDGVAEELTLKTNEITRLSSAFLEGTYAVHGIEEVMNPDETVILVEPFPEQLQKFDTVLRKGVGLNVVAISSQPTPFPTISIPPAGELAPYVQLAAGWNLLVEIGLARGVDLDHPVRARKVGNEL